jgi:hypothetical protein
MDLAALRARVRSLTSILSPSVLSDAELDAFINEAHNLLCLAADWPFLVHVASVSVGTNDSEVVVPLPAGRSAQRLLDVFGQTEQGAKPWQLFERAQPTISETGAAYPREYEWVPATATLRLFPTASRSYVLRVRAVLDPTVMVAGGDVPLLPAPYRHGIAYMASALILEREADTTGRVEAYQVRAGGVIEEMRRLLLTSSRTTAMIGSRVSRRRTARRQVW